MAQVEEVQGLYGPFQFPELLLQRIWAEQGFDRSQLRTESGEAVKLIRPGQWNRQGGPDFKQAEIMVGRKRFSGDIELHLHEKDWQAHQHNRDPAFDDVILHVVLFPSARKTTAGSDGRRIPVLTLLPHLWHDLEEYAADAAVSAIAQRPADRLAQAWLELDEAATRARIVSEAHRRWEGKVYYARQRITKLGWTSACHHTALEILGYRFNRAPMLMIATSWPLAAWQSGDLDMDAVWASQMERWQLAGVRPANHPRKRLAAYARWVQQGRDWPARLEDIAQTWPELPGGLTPQSEVAAIRRELDLKGHWLHVMSTLGVQGAVAQPRADNLWGDGLLPLLAAANPAAQPAFFVWWFGSWPGDQAANLARAARMAGIADGRRNPLAWGHVQGLIGQQLADENPAGRGT